MNKIIDLPPHAANADLAGAPTDYRPARRRIDELARSPATVAGAVLSAAVLGFFTARRSRRPAAKIEAGARSGVSPRLAAHRLASRPLPAAKAMAMARAEAAPGAMQDKKPGPWRGVKPGTGPGTKPGAGPGTKPGAGRWRSGLGLGLLSLVSGAGRGRKEKPRAKAARKRAGIEPGSTRQLMDLGRSLMSLFNAFEAVNKAAQSQTNPAPAPGDAALPVVAPPAPATPAAAVPAASAGAATASPAASSQPAFHPIPKGPFLARSWQMIKATVTSWIDDYAPSMGAALSYYTLFSLAPMLVIVIAVAGLIFGADAARGEIVGQLRGLMGEEGAVAVEGLLKSANSPSGGIIATIIGVVTLLIGATAVFAELQSSLDRIWRTPAPPNENGIWGLIRTRILSFGLILGLGFLSLVSLAISAGLAAFGRWWGELLGNWEVVLQLLNIVISLGVSTAVFAMIYKLMPRAKLSWHDVWIGAAVTAVLFTIGKFLIGLYIGKSGVASGFGAAGSMVVLLVWVYYSTQIFLLGAEFTWVYTRRNAPPERVPDQAQTPTRSAAGA